MMSRVRTSAAKASTRSFVNTARTQRLFPSVSSNWNNRQGVALIWSRCIVDILPVLKRWESLRRLITCSKPCRLFSSIKTTNGSRSEDVFIETPNDQSSVDARLSVNNNESHGLQNGNSSSAKQWSLLSHLTGTNDNDSSLLTIHTLSYASRSELESMVLKIQSINTSITFHSMIECLFPILSTCASKRTSWGAELSERILATCLKNRGGRNDEDAPNPTAEMYSLAINAWAKVTPHVIYNARRADQILRIMWKEYERDCCSVEKYNASLMHHDTDQKEKGNKKRVMCAKPDLIHYTAVINAWAKSVSVNNLGAKKSEHLLKKMEKLSGFSELLMAQSDTDIPQSNNTDECLAPDRICYNSVLYAWSRTSDSGIAYKRIGNILEKMETLATLTRNENLRPNTKSFNLWIMSLGDNSSDQKSSQGTRKGKQQSQSSSTLQSPGEAAEMILAKMCKLHKERLKHHHEHLNLFSNDSDSNTVKPNTTTYNCIINVWSKDKSGRGPKRAEQILFALLEKGKKVDDLPMIKDGEHIMPDIVTVNSVANAWAKSGLPEAGERAEAILNAIIEDSNSHSPNFNIRPDTITCNSVILAHAQRGTLDGMERAEAVLNRMIKSYYGTSRSLVKPNSISFSSMIHAWARCADDTAAERAETLLNRMERLFQETEDTKILPSIACYSGVLTAWTANRVNGPKRAEAILRRMQMTKSIPPPTTSHYNLVIEAWANDLNHGSVDDGAGRENKVQKCRSILQDMIFGVTTKAVKATLHGDDVDEAERVISINHPSPDVHSFNLVIQACTTCIRGEEAKQEAFFTAVDTYNQLCLSGACDPNEQTYVLMLRMVHYLLPDKGSEHTMILDKLFQQCCEDGLVSKTVLQLLQDFSPEWALDKLLPTAVSIKDTATLPLNSRDLPSHWSRNVILQQVEKKGSRRRKLD